MANAVTRAHVGDPQPIAADPGRKSSNKDIHASPETTPIEPTTQTISRKDHRKQKKKNIPSQVPSQPSSDTASPPKTPPNNPPRKKPRAPQPSTPVDHSLSIRSMPAARNATQKAYSLLVCSLGNPGTKYADTLHSAGHTVTSHIASVKRFQPFRKGLSGLVSRPENRTFSFGLFQGYKEESTSRTPPGSDDWTFWQSTSLMNVSGTGVKKAWREWSKRIEEAGLEPRLVVVHDELEAPLGKVSVKEGTASARGHNGLKSCQASLGNTRWWRIGVGIGRPESREPDVVSRYVLRKMARHEMAAMEKASSAVVDALREISEGTR